MIDKKKLLKTLDTLSLTILIPFVKLITGENPKEQIREIVIQLGLPLVAFMLFIFVWQNVASQLETKYGTVPTPAQVWTQAKTLYQEHQNTNQAKAEFSEKWDLKALEFHEKSAQFKAEGDEKKAALFNKLALKAETRQWTGEPTYIENITTSVKTVFCGFVIASILAIPVGVFCGLSKNVMTALNPLIQMFKPVSPLAWFPIVAIVIGGIFTVPDEAPMPLAFMTSAITVALCSLWPTLVNTALGVASIEKDYLNVAKVLKLGYFAQIFKIILPSSLPLMFTGLRISLGVGWMVLIAAEMLAQNPGLGKFVWDMFQNGSSQTLAQIMVAVFTIGFIGFLLDRTMVILQKAVSFNATISA